MGQAAYTAKALLSQQAPVLFVTGRPPHALAAFNNHKNRACHQGRKRRQQTATDTKTIYGRKNQANNNPRRGKNGAQNAKDKNGNTAAGGQNRGPFC